jgi:hypothetical protein
MSRLGSLRHHTFEDLGDLAELNWGAKWAQEAWPFAPQFRVEVNELGGGACMVNMRSGESFQSRLRWKLTTLR